MPPPTQTQEQLGEAQAVIWRAQSGAPKRRGPTPLERDCPPPAGEEAMPRSRGAPGRGGAEESYRGITTPRGTGGEAKGHLSPAAPPPAAGRGPRDRRRGERSQVISGQEEYRPGARTVEAAQGVTEGPKSAGVPVLMARRRAGVAGTAGTGGEAGPGWNGAVSGLSPRPATHDASKEGRV